MQPTYLVRAPITGAQLSALHARAFGYDHHSTTPWADRLERHSITWVTAHLADDLVGFVNVIGDGGAHAVLLDTIVDPHVQRAGIGRGLVERAVAEARALGCEWVHVDYEEALADFYERVCGFGPTRAGLRRLR